MNLRMTPPADPEPVNPPDQAAWSAAEPATPMIAQYIEIKAANPDSLLFYRMGDFYELFFADAEVASRALGIALTKRGRHAGQDIPMCGVPIFAADDYLQKLIALGHRVAVCEQLEDPAEAKKRGHKSVVRRDVVRLVTPGTLTEDRLLEPGRSNYLLAVGRAKGSALAIAWIDISTGHFRVAETAPDRLLADIARIDPAEVIVADTAFADAGLRPVFDVLGRTVHPQPASLFDAASAEARIARFFRVGTTEGFGSFSRPELSAVGAIVAYVEKTQLSERPPLERPQKDEAGASLFLDAATRASLEILRTASGTRDGSLLRVIDRTVTGAGGRLLCERLTAPLTDPGRIAERLDSVSFFRAERHLADALRAELKGMPDTARALTRLAMNRGSPRDLGALRAGFETAAAAAALLAEAELPAELKAAREALLALPHAFAAKLGEALSDELPLLKRDGGFVRAGFRPDLDEAKALRDESRRVIAAMERELIAETGVKALKIRHNNILGFYIEVTANNAAALNGTEEARRRFIHRQTMASAMRFSTRELAELESRIAEAGERALAIELAVFDALVAEAATHAPAILSAASALAVLDVSAALADLAEREDWCRPAVDNSLVFAIEGGRHPVVEAALKRAGTGTSFVPNDCDLSPPEGADAGAIWLLTGPNMGGKSTFLRQNAVIAILAQAGSHVPARSARIGVVDRLFSRVGASDDLARGRSTFMVEMVETAAILNGAGARALVILDEIGRGTATFDGLSIAWAAIEHLHAKNRCRAIFATHFHEMTALSQKLPRLSNVTMRVKEWDGDVVFLHEVGKGAADRSYGVQVARLAGLPPSVVNRAKQVLAKLESGEATGPKAARLVDDLPLFQAAARVPEPDALRESLAALDCDALSPREALEALYRLKDLIKRDEGELRADCRCPRPTHVPFLSEGVASPQSTAAHSAHTGRDPPDRSMRYSALSILLNGLRGNRDWKPAWRQPALRPHYDVVIVGGGGHGLSTAYYLAKEFGVRNVAVLEKGYLGSGNIGRNTTIIRSNYLLPGNNPFYELSLKLWEGLEQDFNYNAMVSQRGVLNLCHNDGQRDAYVRRGNAMRLHGVDAEYLDREAVRKMLPFFDYDNARFPIMGGLFQPRGGTVRHDAVAWGYARGADARGVDVIQHCEVTGIRRENGRVTGVQTNRGFIGAGKLALATAGHSSVTARMVDMTLPVESHVLQAFVSEGLKPFIDTVVTYGAGHFYISQSDKGGLVFGGDIDGYNSYAQRGNLATVEHVAEAGVAMIPSLSRTRFLRSWGGVMDMSMDGSPIIDRTHIPNLYLNTGWCYGGFKATPASGFCFAHLIAKDEPHRVARAFRLDRFRRGYAIDERGAGAQPNLH